MPRRRSVETLVLGRSHIVAALLAAACAIDPLPVEAENILAEFDQAARACALSQTSSFPTSQILSEFSPRDEAFFRINVVPSLPSYVRFAIFCSFKATEPIINFFTPVGERDVEWRRYLDGHPTKEFLLNELGQILKARDGDPRGQSGRRFDTLFSTPRQAVKAAMQPMVAGASYRDALRLEEFYLSSWLDRVAANAARYQSKNGVVHVFEDAYEDMYR